MNKHDVDDLTDAFAGVVRAFGDVCKALNAMSDRLPQSDQGYVCVRCNTEHLVSRDGPPYVYCHDCAVRAPAPSPALAAIVEAADAMREQAWKYRSEIAVERAVNAYDRARAALEGKDERNG